MKTSLLFIICLTLSLGVYAQNEVGKSVTVTINTIKNDTGKVILGLHTTDTFMKTKSLQTQIIEIKDGKIEATFSNIIPGEYAILALHDENNNKKMDFSPNGMPKEDYGLSNNPMSFGPPQFNEAKFKVSTEAITLNIIF